MNPPSDDTIRPGSDSRDMPESMPSVEETPASATSFREESGGAAAGITPPASPVASEAATEMGRRVENAPDTLPDMQAAQTQATHSGRVMQEQPAVRPTPRTQAEAMRPEVPGEIPTGIDGDEAEREMQRKSRRSFLWAGVTLATGFAGWRIFTHNPQQDGILSPLRHALQFNENLSHSFFSSARLAPTFPVSMAQDMKVNGTYGVEDDLDMDAWHLKVEGAQGHSKPLILKMEDIKALPRVEMVTQHKCIEGWSVIVHWAGARFSDFAAQYMPPARSGQTPDLRSLDSLVRYVSMMTPDGNYYVGLDMESALHPQTLLCYEMNGQPLTEEHGAPLRLVIPIKYGIKSIKRIGTIAYTDKQPADYWAEQGYDWYSGH